MFTKLSSILKWIWKAISWTRIFLLNVVFIVVVVLIIGSINAAPNFKSPNNSALVIAPVGDLVDQLSFNTSVSQSLIDPQSIPIQTLLRDVTKAIRKAATDKRISGIILHVDDMQRGGISKIEEIGQALDEFKESGKPIVAYADSMTQAQYMLASYADEIYLNNLGNVYLTGLGVYRNYFKGLSDKLSVNFHVFRVGQFKDAIEPFTREDMSDASKKHIKVWMDSLWKRYASIVETNRDIDSGAVTAFVDNYDDKLVEHAGDSAKLLLNERLIDGAVSKISMQEILAAKFGTEDASGELNAIGMQAYLNNPSLNINPSKNNIGLIVASGNIVSGHQNAGAIGSETLSELIEKAKNDDSLKALVMRVDSGGGSAFASEVIREQLQDAKASGLPIYISMGSVAASGGYWISAPATEIWATPATLTGSIGVFGLFPDISESLKNIGITSDGVATSPLAGATHIDRPLSEEAKTLYQSGVDYIYQRFLSLVSKERGKTTDEVHEIAQGRVWSGEKAKELGLIDELGSLNDVFAAISQDQQLGNFKIKVIEPTLSTQEQFIRAILQQANIAIDGLGLPSSVLSLLEPSPLNKVGNLNELFTLRNQSKNGELQVFANCMTCIAL